MDRTTFIAFLSEVDVAPFQTEQFALPRTCGYCQEQQCSFDAIARLAGGSALAGNHLLPSLRGDLFLKMGKFTEKLDASWPRPREGHGLSL